MLLASRAWFPLGRGKQGPVFEANLAKTSANAKKPKKIKTMKKEKMKNTKTNIGDATWNLGTLNGRGPGVMEINVICLYMVRHKI